MKWNTDNFSGAANFQDSFNQKKSMSMEHEKKPEDTMSFNTLQRSKSFEIDSKKDKSWPLIS